MHNAEMNSADFSGIVVNKTNGLRIKCTLNVKFFAHLPLNSVSKCLLAESKCKE